MKQITTSTRAYKSCWLLLLVLLCLGACGGADRSGPQDSLLTRGIGDEPESLDMHRSRSTEAGDVQRDLGEGLTGYTPDGKLITTGAERWSLSDDGIEYTFWLRPDARWSNGDPVTAHDYVYSFRRLVNPATAAFYVQSVGDVENAADIIAGNKPMEKLGIEALDEYQLRIRLHQPVPYFLSLLTHPSTFPVHRESVEIYGDLHSRPGNLVSNGAYKLVTWEVGSYIELIRNEYYWNNANTAIDRVRHQVTSEPQAELNRYRAGELDTTRTIPTDAFARMLAERPDEVHVSPRLGVYYYGFNMTKPPFAEQPKVRQALSMALDRETIVNSVTKRGERPAYGWVPDGTNNYDSRRFTYADMPAEQRHVTARQLLREAGYGPDKPLEFELRYNTSDTHRQVAVAAQSMWQKVLEGVTVKLVNEEFQVLLSNIQQKEVIQMYRLNWDADYNDANTFLSTLESGNPSNLTGYRSADFDSLMQRAAAQTDPERRKIILEEAEIVMLNDHPLIPIYFYVNKSMVSPRVRGWGDNVLNYHYSQHLSFSADD